MTEIYTSTLELRVTSDFLNGAEIYTSILELRLTFDFLNGTFCMDLYLFIEPISSSCFAFIVYESRAYVSSGNKVL